MSWVLVFIIFVSILYLWAYAKPLLDERSYARSLLKFIDGPRPHWLFGHLRLVSPDSS